MFRERFGRWVQPASHPINTRWDACFLNVLITFNYISRDLAVGTVGWRHHGVDGIAAAHLIIENVGFQSGRLNISRRWCIGKIGGDITGKVPHSPPQLRIRKYAINVGWGGAERSGRLLS